MKTQAILVMLLATSSLSMVANARQDSPTHATSFLELTHKWYFVLDQLKTYEGLNRYCADPAFQREVVETLKKIHEYDSTLYIALTALYEQSPDRTVKKALKKVGHIEHKYNSMSLSKTLRSECHTQRQLERSYRKVKNYFGAHSFDNQVMLTEAHLDKHVGRISRLMARIEDHLHHID